MGSVVPVVAEPDHELKPDEVVTVIDLDELEEDRRDAVWQAFLDEARAYRSKLRLEGRVR